MKENLAYNFPRSRSISSGFPVSNRLSLSQRFVHGRSEHLQGVDVVRSDIQHHNDFKNDRVLYDKTTKRGQKHCCKKLITFLITSYYFTTLVVNAKTDHQN